MLKSVFEEDTQNEKYKKFTFKSEVLVQVFESKLVGLLDTGSDITCISEELWNSLLIEHPDIPVMKIKPFQIKTAVGQKSVEIKILALLPLKLGIYEKDVGFLVVPKLSSPLIFGFDWMKDNEITINLSKSDRCILLKQGGKRQAYKFFDRNNRELATQNFELDCRRVSEIDISKPIKYKTGVDLSNTNKSKLDKLIGKYNKLFSNSLGRAIPMNM